MEANSDYWMRSVTYEEFINQINEKECVGLRGVEFVDNTGCHSRSMVERHKYQLSSCRREGMWRMWRMGGGSVKEGGQVELEIM